MTGHLRFGLLVAGTLALLFPGIVLRGEALFERDLHQMLYGQYAAIARLVRAGSWPLWDPWPGFGQPLLANPAAQVLYPPTWLCLLLSPEATYSVYVFGHLAVGAFGARALAARLGASPWAAAGAGLLFVASGPTLSLVNLWHHLAGAMLMPVVVAAAHAALRSPTWRSGVAWGAAAGLQALAGSFDMCVLTAALSAALWIHGLCARGEERVRATAGLAVPVLVGSAVALALAAGLLLPLLDLWRQSARAALSESVRTFWSVTPGLALQVFLPFFPQRLPLPPDLQGRLLENREPFLASLYLGLATLPLVAGALWPRPRRHALLLGAGALVLLGLALGRHGLLYPALVSVVPPLASLRYPVKATAALALVWAVLAALGADAWSGRARGDRSSRASLAIAGLVVLLALGGAVIVLGPQLRSAAWTLGPAVGLALAAGAAALLPFQGRSLAVVLLALAGLDLAVAHRFLNPTAGRDILGRAPEVVSALPPPSGFVRVQAWDYLVRILGKSYRRPPIEVPRRDAPHGTDATLAGALARRDFLSPPVGARFGLHGAFDPDWLGLQPPGPRRLGLWLRAAEETEAFPVLLRRGGVTHTVALHDEGLEALAPVTAVDSPFAGRVRVRRVEHAFSRVYAVSGVRVATGLEALRLLSDPAFEAERDVLLTHGIPRPAVAGAVSEARLREDSGDRLRVEAHMASAGHVVVLDAWDAGWEAYRDGQRVPLLEANVAFRAVEVPEGRHEIELRYRPRGLPAGLLSTLAAALVCVGTFATRARKAA